MLGNMVPRFSGKKKHQTEGVITSGRDTMDAILHDKVALVTGAAGPMGTAVVKQFVSQGCTVAMLDINREGLQKNAEEFGPKAIPFVADIKEIKQVQAVYGDIEQRLGGVDILVNNAGILSNNKVLETSAEEWNNVMSINLDGAFYLSQQVIPHMKAKGWGRIINTCSLAAKTGGITAGTAYTTSKGALTSFTFSLARELAGEGITVNGISPAYVKTPMITEQLNESQRQELLEQIPVGRFCETEEFAHVVSFLAHPLSGFITGEVVDINGGLLFD
jgi:3-oxoacyl-[acyl-carrier protein] reductase